MLSLELRLLRWLVFHGDAQALRHLQNLPNTCTVVELDAALALTDHVRSEERSTRVTICIEALENDEQESNFDRCDGVYHYRFCPLYKDGPAMHCPAGVHHVWPRAGGYHYVGHCPEREPWQS